VKGLMILMIAEKIVYIVLHKCSDILDREGLE
jgi:hypothetical protein